MRGQHWTTFVCVLGVAILAAADLAAGDRDFSEWENRYLQKKPPITLRTLADNSFTLKYEEYLNDQFVWRDGCIALKSRAESVLGKLENNGVVYGEDGYLFARERAPDRRLAQNIANLYTFFDRYRSLSPALMLVPASYAVMPDKLPEGLDNMDQLALIKDIGDDLPAGLALWVAGQLSAHRDEYIYYRTDHHWTALGAYYAYEEYMLSLGCEPIKLETLMEHRREDFYGTYHAKAKKADVRPDALCWYDIEGVKVTIDGQPAEGLYELSKLEERDKYGIFLHGNNGLTLIENSAAPKQSLLVVKDSYANSLVPYLAASFSRIAMVDLRYYTGTLSELVAEQNPDRVLVLYGLSGFASDLYLNKLAQ
jgi:hypothetical protein